MYSDRIGKNIDKIYKKKNKYCAETNGSLAKIKGDKDAVRFALGIPKDNAKEEASVGAKSKSSAKKTDHILTERKKNKSDYVDLDYDEKSKTEISNEENLRKIDDPFEKEVFIYICYSLLFYVPIVSKVTDVFRIMIRELGIDSFINEILDIKDKINPYKEQFGLRKYSAKKLSDCLT